MALDHSYWLGGTFVAGYTISTNTTTAHNIRTHILGATNPTCTPTKMVPEWDGVSTADITVTVNNEQGAPGAAPVPATTGSLQSGTPYPAASKIHIIVNSGKKVTGAGGDQPAGGGWAGISINHPVTITNNGTISGGGGAGKHGNPTSSPTPPSPGSEADPPTPNPPSTTPGGYGGGGAGYAAGNPGASTTAGGSAGHNAGAGGGLGAVGGPSPAGSGGAAGYYIVQNGNAVTWKATGTRNGNASS
jgi:hypothetical protein